MIYLLIASFLWGTSFIAGKIAYNMFDPSLVVALRYIFASIILSPVTISFMRQEKETINKKDWNKTSLYRNLIIFHYNFIFI